MNNNNMDIVLDSNPRYSQINSEAKVLIENLASNVKYEVVPATSRSYTSMTFHVDLDGFFLDRSIVLNINELPLICNVNAPQTGAVVTALNFHQEVFKNYKKLALKQLGFINAIDSISVKLDGTTIDVKDVNQIMDILVNYYDQDEIHKYLDASAPDLLYSNEIQTTTNTDYIPSVGVDGHKMLLKICPGTLDTNNPFSAISNSSFNSRTPQFSSTYTSSSFDGNNTKVAVKLQNTSVFLPLSIFGINEETPIYNASKMIIQINLHNDWPNRIFDTVKGADGEPMYSFQIDRSSDTTASGSSEHSLYVRLYKPPAAIESKLNRNLPYAIQYPLVELDTRTTEINFRKNRFSDKIITTPFDLRGVPKKIFLAIVPKQDVDKNNLLKNKHFCRIDALSCELMGNNTIISRSNGSEQLFQLCKKNGLNLSKQAALHTKGFPVSLSVSDDIGAGNEAFVGLNITGASTGKHMIKFNIDFTRLHSEWKGGPITAATTEDELWEHETNTVYELRVVFVYQSYLLWRGDGAKFAVVESLNKADMAGVNVQLEDLYSSFIPRANILGGAGFFASLIPTFKKYGNMGINIIKAIASNKDGLRDKLVAASGGANTLQSNIIGGFDAHAPLMGAGKVSNWSELKY